ncbi:ABC transporter permease [Planococcus salinus]|uniref:ABC transporter permease n=1 Tax=Planococcus salinus TaxID=1848460 RepID=A0A3M8P8H9_9BACL|nr:ABC transporter permease [Planococcus salinus]RNF39560.1 ABC transporter permease [Planococcus salinus]
MWAFLKKDILVLLRDRTELAVLLLMPFILIVILGFSLRGLLMGDTEALNMQVALVQHDDEQAGIEQFTGELEAAAVPDQAAEQLEAAAGQVSPSSLLQSVLSSPELEEMLDVMELDEEAARQALQNEEVTAILTIPEDFTLLALRNMLLGEGPGSELELTVADTTSTRANVFQDILTDFTRSLNFETAVARAAAAEGGAISAESPAVQLGGVETVSAREPVNSFQYYTLGMAVMFVLFVSSTIAGKANVERQQHVFNRILLTNRHPFVYLSGKVLSSALISFCQLFVLFLFSTIVLQAFEWNSLEFWLGMAGISAVLAVCVGALAALLTSLTMRFNSDAIVTVFAGGIVTILAFLGGSFIPVSEMPGFLQAFGDWTPNGASMTAYLSWIQERDMTRVMDPLSRVGGTAVVLIAGSLLLFPTRGGD